MTREVCPTWELSDPSFVGLEPAVPGCRVVGSPQDFPQCFIKSSLLINKRERGMPVAFPQREP